VAVAARFFGRYEHALDAKGRLILPAKLRAHFDRPGYLAPHLEGCLALWRDEEFQEEINVRLALAEEGPAQRNEVREWSSKVFEAEIDRQGRMAIPTDLRDYAALGQEVLVVGMINRVELWAPEVWALRVHETTPSSGNSGNGE
jgi:MraZ protein